MFGATKKSRMCKSPISKISVFFSTGTKLVRSEHFSVQGTTFPAPKHPPIFLHHLEALVWWGLLLGKR